MAYREDGKDDIRVGASRWSFGLSWEVQTAAELEWPGIATNFRCKCDLTQKRRR
jgi:hypothetical protein